MFYLIRKYFSAGHVGDINMHQISEKIHVAFLSSKVKPSMKAIPDYQVWALLKKERPSLVDPFIVPTAHVLQGELLFVLFTEK